MTRLRTVAIGQMDERLRAELFARSAVPDPAVRRSASQICEDVATRGDAAVADHAHRLGGGHRRIAAEELDEALAALDAELVEAIGRSIENVSAYHRTQLPADTIHDSTPGVVIRRRWSPLNRVGCYVPGGKAAYPSTVIMTVIPAKVAGVSEVVVCTPCDADGGVHPVTLAACRLAGADEVWALGGAQAIAAMAYGTETFNRVQSIVGPGNAWVTAAKIAVFGVCSIDMPAGPSEVLVIADDSAEARLVAVDLLCQAEHGPDSPAILVTTDPELPARVEAEISALVDRLERADILEKALADHGWAVITSTIDEAVELANAYAGEHVSVMTSNPEQVASRVTAAGSVYVGRWAPESAGDYATGANHVLPTGGLADAIGPLSIDQFGSWRQEQHISRDGLTHLLPIITNLAQAEGLTAHRLSAELRFHATTPPIPDQETP